jgi:hypothetical protein
MGNFSLQTSPCNFLKLRISPWEVLIPFLLCSSSFSALSLPWRLLSFLHGRRSLPSSLPLLLWAGTGASGSGGERARRSRAAGAQGRAGRSRCKRWVARTQAAQARELEARGWRRALAWRGPARRLRAQPGSAQAGGASGCGAARQRVARLAAGASAGGRGRRWARGERTRLGQRRSGGCGRWRRTARRARAGGAESTAAAQSSAQRKRAGASAGVGLARAWRCRV